MPDEAAAERALRDCDTTPEVVTLAETVDTWWPEIEAFLLLNVTNARTQGFHRTIKDLSRVARGIVNQTNYQRRILAYATAPTAASPAKINQRRSPRTVKSRY